MSDGTFTIRLLTDVRGDFPYGDTFAPAGEIQATCNMHGAVSVLATNGKPLGVKPGEFEYVTLPPNGEPIAMTPRQVRSMADELWSLRAKLAKPYAYWSDVDEETAQSDPLDFVEQMQWMGAEPGCVFYADPLVRLDREWYGVVPEANGEWTDGVYAGDLDMVGPCATRDAALADATSVTREMREAWERDRQMIEDNGGAA